jgi:hypothetical protein
MIRQIDIWAFFAGLYYGIGVHLLTDLSIVLQTGADPVQGFFQPCRYVGNAIFASSSVYVNYFLWKNLLLHDETVNRQYEWSMSLATFLTVGIGYATAIVYPTEIICSVYYTSLDHILDRILLGTPSVLVLFCFAELCGWNASLRRQLRLV